MGKFYGYNNVQSTTLNIQVGIKLKTSKCMVSAVGITMASACFNANAWFFFFIPPSVASKVGDTFTGSEGDNCVGAAVKVGDTFPSSTGNVAIVKSLSGLSSRCQQPGLPIRALLQFKNTFSSKAGIELPDSFKPKELSEAQKFNGLLLSAQDPAKIIGISVAAQPIKTGDDGGVLAKKTSTRLLAAVDGGVISDDEVLFIGGIQSYRFRMVGKNKGMFGRSFTYVVTVLVGRDELVQVNANCLTSDFEKYKDMLYGFASEVRGLNGEGQRTTLAVDPAIAPERKTAEEIRIGEVKRLPLSNNATQGVEFKKRVEETPAVGNREISLKPRPQSEQQPVAAEQEKTIPPASSSVPQKLRELNKLFKDGIISNSEFQSKKAELLKAL